MINPALGTCYSQTWVDTWGICAPQLSKIDGIVYIFIFLVQGIFETKLDILKSLGLYVGKKHTLSLPNRGPKQISPIHSKLVHDKRGLAKSIDILFL